MKLHLHFMLCVLFFAVCAGAQAPAPNSSQEAAVIEKQLEQVRFENDGTSVRETTMSIRIQSEAGVERFGQIVEGYSSAIETLDVDYVRVRKPNGEVIETPKSNEQDFAPEVLISAPMYSDYRQRHITVVGLRPGDVLEYHIVSRTKKPLANGEFWFEYSFPKWLAVNQSKLEIDVPKDRRVTLKSPKRKYTTTDAGERRIYTWVVENITPDRKSLTEALEDRDSDDAEADSDDDSVPEIQLTTFKSWQEVGHWYAKLQGERVIVDDAIRAKAAEITKGDTTPLEKTRHLYDYVARNYRYVSLSFGVGALQPHAAPDILKGGYGDCKDKHTLLEALLRAEGITSYPVLIHSSRKLDRDVPSPAQFDHEITAVHLDNGFTWLDTTAEVAPFALLSYEIRNKDALLASDDASAGIVRSPSTVPVKNTLAITLDGKVLETGVLDATFELVATGDSGFEWRAAMRSVAQADWERFLQAMSARDSGAKITDIDIGPLEDTSKPFHLKYHMRQENYFRVPSTETNYFPFLTFGLPGTRMRAHRGEPLDVGPAVEVTQRVHLEFPANFNLRLPPDLVLTRDYADFRTSEHVTGNVLEAQRKLVLKVDQLPETRRPDFETLRSVLLNTAAQTIQFTARPASRAAVAAGITPAGDSAEDLRKAATKAMKQRDFQTASELLKRTVEKEPDSKAAWDDLGRAYARLGNHADAVTALQKQIEINPYHKTACKDLGDELQYLGRYEEAVAAYRKHLENQPLDAGAHKSLGLLLLQLKRDKDAAEQLQAAAAIPPADPETELALALAYERLGDAAKEKPLLVLTVGDAPAYPEDFYAAATSTTGDATEAVTNGKKLLNDIGDQFDSNAYADNPPDVFSAMHFVALGWARVGAAMARNGEVLNGIRYLESAWELSQSPHIAARLAQVNEDAGRKTEGKRWYALAAAAGDQAAREHMAKLYAAGSAKALSQAQEELVSSQKVKLTGFTGKSGSAEFNLVFDGTEKPERAEFWSGDAALRNAVDALANATYPVTFPDVSSIKIVRRVTVSCSAAGCFATLMPTDAVAPPVRAVPPQTAPKTQATISQK